MKVPKCLVLMSFLFSSAMSVTFSQAILPVGENFKISDEAGADPVGGKLAIVGDGINFFVVWKDRRNYSTTANDVYGARVSHNGIVLETSGIRISRSTGDLEVTATPSVAFDGTNYLVVWVGTVPGTSVNEIFGVRVSRNGVVLDTSEFRLTINGDPRPRPISLDFDGTNFLIVWRTNGSQIRGMRVSPTVVNLDSSEGFMIATKDGDFYPWVAFGDTTFMVTWFGWGKNGSDIFGARVTRDGVVLDPEGFIDAEPPQDQAWPAIAFDGTNFLVVWHDSRDIDPHGNGSAYGTRVSARGTVLDNPAFKIADHALSQVPVVTVFDGTQYIVVWHEYLWPAKYRASDVYGRRVSREGRLLDDKPIPISTSYGHQWGPVVGCDSSYILVAWSESLSAGRSYDGGVFGQMLQKGPTNPFGLISPSVSNTDPLRPSRAVHQNIGGWIPQSSPTSQPIHSIWGFSDTSIFAGTEDGMIIGYHGNQWSVLTPTPIARHFGLWGSSPSDLWTVGWGYDIARFDGSRVDRTNSMNWPTWTHPIGMGIWGFGTTNRITVGVQGGCFRYLGTNFDSQPELDRSNWREQLTGVNYDLWDIWGSAPNNVYAVGEFGTILKYDGGNWTRVKSVPTIQSLNGVWGIGGSDIFVVGDFGTILHYDGATWTNQASNTSEDLFGVWGFNGSDVYAVGRYGAIVHYDGSTWAFEPSGTTQHLMGIWAGRNTVWAVGDDGTILRKDIATGVRNSDQIPTKYGLEQNYPNPFNPGTTINYSLPKSATISLRIFNTLGQEVASLVNEQKPPGFYQVQWNANAPSGIYFYRLQAGEYMETKKMTLLK